MKLLKIIEKNLKVLIRSKSSLLVMILGPLLIIILVGLAFSNISEYDVLVAVHSDSYSTLSNSFVTVLGESGFTIIPTGTLEECIQLIKDGGAHMCISFPPDMALSNNETNEVVIYVDNSNFNLVYAVRDSVSEKLAIRSDEISEGITDEILDVMDEVDSSIIEQNNRLGRLNEEQYAARDEALGLDDDFRQMDLSFNTHDFAVGDVKESLEDIDDASEAMREHAALLANVVTFNVDEYYHDVERAYESLKDSNASTHSLDDVLDMFNETSDYAQDKNRSISTEREAIVDLVDDSFTAIANSEAALIETANRFSEISNAREDLKTGVATVGDSLKEISDNITDVRDVLRDSDFMIKGLAITSSSTITRPIVTKIEPVVMERSRLNYIFPFLLVMVVMFVAMLLSATIVVREKDSRAHFRNFTTPCPDITFILGNFLTTLLLTIVQVGILVAAGLLIFNALMTNVALSFVVLIFVSILFIVIGLAVGYLFSSGQSSILGALSVGSVMLLVSDFILPLESMPTAVRGIARFNPFVLGSDVLRKTMLFGSGIFDVVGTLAIILVYSAIIFLLVWGLDKATKRNYFKKYSLRFVRGLEIRQIERRREKITDVSKFFTTYDKKYRDNPGAIADAIRSIHIQVLEEFIKDYHQEYKSWFYQMISNKRLAARAARKKTKGGLVRLLDRAREKKPLRLPIPMRKKFK